MGRVQLKEFSQENKEKREVSSKLDLGEPGLLWGWLPISCEDKCKAEVSEGSRVWNFRYSKQGESGSLILYNGFDNPQNLLVTGKKQDNKHSKQNEKQ